MKKIKIGIRCPHCKTLYETDDIVTLEEIPTFIKEARRVRFVCEECHHLANMKIPEKLMEDLLLTYVMNFRME